jgi:hypothetical protein
MALLDLSKFTEDIFGTALGLESEAKLTVDYSQGVYDELEKVYFAKNNCNFQFGAAFARPIVEITTAFEVGYGVIPIVLNKDGKVDDDLTAFLQSYIETNIWSLLQACTDKAAFGDTYVSLTLDRSLEVLSPKFVTPQFYMYNDQIESLEVTQYKFKINPATKRRVKVAVKRFYDKERVEYSAEGRGITVKPVKLDNPFGFVPVVKLSNLLTAGKQFGLPEYYYSIPYMNAWHKVLMRAIEAQQYMGKPILQITGISGSIKVFIQNMFGVNVDTDTDEDINEAVRKFYERFRTLMFPNDAKASFIEAKFPLGEAAKLLDKLFGNICSTSMVPQFLFGEIVDSAQASLREQYETILTKTENKRRYLQQPLSKICQMVLIAHSLKMENPETETSYDSLFSTINFDTFDKGDLKIKFIWPTILTSDNRLKTDTLLKLQAQNTMSKKTLLENFPEFVPNPDKELVQLEEEAKIFESTESGTQSGKEPTGGQTDVAKRKMRDQQDVEKGKGPADTSGGV